MTWNQLYVSPSNSPTFFPTSEQSSCVGGSIKCARTHTHICHLQDRYSDKVLKFNKRFQVEEPFILNATSWQEKKITAWKPVNCDFSPNVCVCLRDHLFKEKKSSIAASSLHLLLCHSYLSLHIHPYPPSLTSQGQVKEKFKLLPTPAGLPPPHCTPSSLPFLFENLQEKITLFFPGRIF